MSCRRELKHICKDDVLLKHLAVDQSYPHHNLIACQDTPLMKWHRSNDGVATKRRSGHGSVPSDVRVKMSGLKCLHSPRAFQNWHAHHHEMAKMIVESMRMCLLLPWATIERRYSQDSLVPNVRPTRIQRPEVLVRARDFD